MQSACLQFNDKLCFVKFDVPCGQVDVCLNVLDYKVDSGNYRYARVMLFLIHFIQGTCNYGSVLAVVIKKKFQFISHLTQYKPLALSLVHYTCIDWRQNQNSKVHSKR